MMKFRHVLPAVMAGLLCISSASAEVIELADGRMMQGEVVPGQTSDEGLAVRVFETGGVVLVQWKHVLPERAKVLRVEYGIDIPEDESVTVPGHVVTMLNAAQVTGVVLNYDEWKGGGSPVQVKTPNGVQPYPRDRIARIDAILIEALQAYTKEELYAQRMDENPPDSAAAHFAMADFCQRIGDYDHAMEHYQEAAKDAEFVETSDGKSLDQRMRRAAILQRAEGAQVLAADIQRAMFRKDWNQALEKLIEMDGEVQDDQIREAVGFDRLRSRVERGRSEHFRRVVPLTVYSVMDDLIKAKVREKKPLRATEDNGMQGTLAGARNWASRELANELWTKVASKLGLEAEELDKFWGERTTRKVQTASYGTGSFIVIQRATLPGNKNRRRRPPGAGRGGGNTGPTVQAAQPKSDEEWWGDVRGGDKAKWLEAYFVESSGLFEIVRADESELCSSCAGRGYTASAGADGGEPLHCVQCNGSGKFRTVKYR